MYNIFKNRTNNIDYEKLNPVYESIKSVKSELNSLNKPLIGFSGAPWTIAAYMLEGNLTKNYNKFQYITGMSISPKTNNCIIKIWTSTCKNINVDILRDNIENLFLDECIFRKNKDAK